MASWMIHLRVAWQLYFQLDIECINEFVLGNIAPDSGVPAEDGTGFIPDASISHFRSIDDNGIKNIHENLFIEKYFTPKCCSSYTKKEFSFFLGYLTHLLTDKIWANEIVYPAKEKYDALFFSDRDLFWRTIKKDWYDLDFMYLKSNPSFEAFRIYREIKNIRNTYVDFFSETAFEDRRRFIIDFYAKGVANIVEHDTYLSREDLDIFVTSAADKITEQISELEQNNTYFPLLKT